MPTSLAWIASRRRRPELALFALVFGAYAYFYQGGGWSANTRFDLTRALVVHGTVAIDAFHENTGDKASRGAHYYCDKAPGVSWLAVPAYAAMHAVRPAALGAGAYVATVFALALPSALGVVVLFGVARGLDLSRRWSAALGVAYGLGTLVWPYATLLHGHALAASLGLAAFALVRKRSFAAAGLLLGTAVCVEYTSAILVVILGLDALVRGGRAAAARLALGGLAPAILLGVYHAAAFGHPLALPYDFVMQEHRHQGWFMGIAAPDSHVTIELLFGVYRGLFYSAPWLLAALPGLVLLWRQGGRSDAVVCAAIFAAYLFMNAGLVDWHGAWAMGPRYLIPTIPFLAIGSIGLLRAAAAASAGRRGAAWIAAVLVTVSLALMLIGVSVKPEVPLDVRRPYADFLLPRFLHGNLGRNTQSIDSEGGTSERQAWNLGHQLGLTGLWTLVPLALWIGATGGWLIWATKTDDSTASAPA